MFKKLESAIYIIFTTPDGLETLRRRTEWHLFTIKFSEGCLKVASVDASRVNCNLAVASFVSLKLMLDDDLIGSKLTKMLHRLTEVRAAFIRLGGQLNLPDVSNPHRASTSFLFSPATSDNKLIMIMIGIRLRNSN